MITILVKAADGTLIASAQSADDARLCIDRVFEDGDTVEIGGDKLLISRRRRQDFMQALTNYFGGR